MRKGYNHKHGGTEKLLGNSVYSTMLKKIYKILMNGNFGENVNY